MAKVTASKILEVARKEIGTKATAVKKCKYNTWYYGSAVSGSCYDWCAAFVCWVFNQAGAMDMIPTKSAGCGVLAAGFNNKGKFYKSGFKAGDIVFFHWSNAKSTAVPGAYTLDHVGIIEKVNSDGTYTTIEGNTGNSAYGEVMRRTRSASVISGVARPDYKSETTSSKTSSSGSSSIKSVQTWLNSTYKTGLTVDGVYGSLTKKALVKALQSEINKQYGAKLVVDGIYGNATNNAVRNLSNGCRGNITKTLQGLLICNGYSTNGFDGIYGNGTSSAVKSYQKKKGLTADGIAGQKTFASLCK